MEVGHYSPGADLFPVCNASCVRPPKHNGTPPVLQVPPPTNHCLRRPVTANGGAEDRQSGLRPILLPQGLYRGLDITNFYAPGEWDVNFGPTNITIKGPNATWSAAVSTGGGSDLAFTLTSGTAGEHTRNLATSLVVSCLHSNRSGGLTEDCIGVCVCVLQGRPAA